MTGLRCGGDVKEVSTNYRVKVAERKGELCNTLIFSRKGEAKVAIITNKNEHHS